MKVKQLKIKNIGMISDACIKLNKPLILFYGEIMQGKTTILNAVKFCFGGSFPDDIIRHGETEASVMLEFENGSIGREWYIGKDGATKARPISLVIDGVSVKKPTDEIKKFLNPFLLDQDFLRNMSEPERKRYFAQLFGADTAGIDAECTTLENDAKTLRAKIKGYGEIDTTPITPVNIGHLKEKLQEIRAGHAKNLKAHEAEVDEIRNAYQLECRKIDTQNRRISTHNINWDRTKTKPNDIDLEIDNIKSQISTLNNRIQDLRAKKNETISWLESNPKEEEKEYPPAPDIVQAPPMPDTSTIEAEISEAAANNVRHEQYLKNVERAKAKDADQQRLDQIEHTQKKLRQKKISKLAEISESIPIAGLSFDENGNFTYQNTQAGMLSTSQIMKLSSELSALYPAGFGLDLIDRGESLGKSIFDFVKRAEREEKTILATIVGEKPAGVPENIGVFVVENGEVK